jgi:hypothetical protein
MNDEVPAVMITTEEWNKLKAEMSPIASPHELLREMNRRLEAKKALDDSE